jgi:hypothetical protein
MIHTSVVSNTTIYGRVVQEIHLHFTGDSVQRFIDFLNRGLNTAADAHSELKELADEIIHGEILQDYKSQTTNKQELYQRIKVEDSTQS